MTWRAALTAEQEQAENARRREFIVRAVNGPLKDQWGDLWRLERAVRDCLYPDQQKAIEEEIGDRDRP